MILEFMCVRRNSVRYIVHRVPGDHDATLNLLLVCQYRSKNVNLVMVLYARIEKCSNKSLSLSRLSSDLNKTNRLQMRAL